MISPIWEEYNAEVGYVGSVGEVREGVERGEQLGGDEDKSEKVDLRKGKRSLNNIDQVHNENVKRKRFRDA